MPPILRVDGTSRELRVGVTRGCREARISGATLSITRSGAAGVPLTLQATLVDERWRAVFVLPDAWLVDQPDGRYAGVLTTACGSATLAFQKGSRARLGAIRAITGPCIPRTPIVAGGSLVPPPPPPPVFAAEVFASGVFT